MKITAIAGFLMLLIFSSCGSSKKVPFQKKPTDKILPSAKQALTYGMILPDGITKNVRVSLNDLKNNPEAWLYVSDSILLRKVRHTSQSVWKNGQLEYSEWDDKILIVDSAACKVMDYDSASNSIKARFTVSESSYYLYFQATPSKKDSINDLTKFTLYIDSVTKDGRRVVKYGSSHFFIEAGAEAYLVVALKKDNSTKKMDVHPGITAGSTSSQSSGAASSGGATPASTNQPRTQSGQVPINRGNEGNNTPFVNPPPPPANNGYPQQQQQPQPQQNAPANNTPPAWFRGPGGGG